ncbi:MAG: hypothetical protein WBB29_00955 [Geitlerinemataceae cyanobacterium]
MALACFHCNRQKADRVNITAESGESIALFNPRQNNWKEHFIWSVDGLSIVGLTLTGNATIEALALNRERVMNIRSVDREIGRHPPPDDPIQTE